MNNTISNLKNFSTSEDSLLKDLHLSSLRIIKTQERLKFFEVGNLGKLSQFDRLCVERFCEWLRNRRDWWVVLERSNVSGVRYYKRDFRFFRVYNRFDKQYVKRVIRRFESLRFFAEDHSFVHIVLTVEGGSICDNLRLLRENWNRFRALLKKRLGCNYPFVAVLEPQKRGQPHLHVLLFTEKYVIDQDKLSEWCVGHNLGKVVWIKRYWAKGFRKKPIYYLVKYLGKQYKRDSWSFWDFVFYACVWCLEVKTYSFSHNFVFPPRRKLKGWSAYVLSYEELIKTIRLNVRMGLWSFSVPLEYFEWDLRDRVLWVVGRK